MSGDAGGDLAEFPAGCSARPAAGLAAQEFVLQRVTERVWWVTRQFYGSLFYVGKRGVLL